MRTEESRRELTEETGTKSPWSVPVCCARTDSSLRWNLNSVVGISRGGLSRFRALGYTYGGRESSQRTAIKKNTCKYTKHKLIKKTSVSIWQHCKDCSTGDNVIWMFLGDTKTWWTLVLWPFDNSKCIKVVSVVGKWDKMYVFLFILMLWVSY